MRKLSKLRFFTVTVANVVFSLDFWIKLTIVSLDFWINIVSLQRLELGKVAKNALKKVGKAPFSV